MHNLVISLNMEFIRKAENQFRHINMIIIGGYAIPNSFNNIFTENNSSFWEWILCIDDEIPKITCIPDYKAIAKFKLTTFYLGDTTVEDRTLIGAFTADTGTTLYLNNTTLLRQSLTGEDIIEQFLIGGGSPSTYYIKGVELKNGLPVIKSYDTWLYSG